MIPTARRQLSRRRPHLDFVQMPTHRLPRLPPVEEDPLQVAGFGPAADLPSAHWLVSLPARSISPLDIAERLAKPLLNWRISTRVAVNSADLPLALVHRQCLAPLCSEASGASSACGSDHTRRRGQLMLRYCRSIRWWRIVLGAGLALGREGPTVQMSACHWRSLGPPFQELRPGDHRAPPARAGAGLRRCVQCSTRWRNLRLRGVAASIRAARRRCNDVRLQRWP